MKSADPIEVRAGAARRRRRFDVWRDRVVMAVALGGTAWALARIVAACAGRP